MKVSTLVAIVVSLPYTLYQAWAFVAPGLYEHERRFIGPLIMASTALFVLGMAFAYFLVFPVLFGFVTSSAPQGVAVMTDIGSYLDFVTTMFVSFGIAFEVPIAVLLLVRFNLVKIESLKEARSYVIVGAFVIGAILTPPDVISQVMLAVPLWILYEAGVFVAGFVAKPQTDA
jgi:sec-independent protein translocase protein TatC